MVHRPAGATSAERPGRPGGLDLHQSRPLLQRAQLGDGGARVLPPPGARARQQRTPRSAHTARDAETHDAQRE